MATNENIPDKIDIEPPTNDNYLQAVKVLHETVVSLRKALERSQSELYSLKEKQSDADAADYIEPKYISDTIEHLALENHVLRRRILLNRLRSMETTSNTVQDGREQGNKSENDELLTEKRTSEIRQEDEDDDDDDDDIAAKESKNNNCSENRTFSFHRCKTDSEESEVDDIEFIFTTEDTKTISFQEELEPISDDGDDVYDSKFESHEPAAIRRYQLPLVRSVLVETDISKCGILGDEHEISNSAATPMPKTQCQPDRTDRVQDFSATHTSTTTTNSHTQTVITKPVIINDLYAYSVRNCETQTDISAVPPHWKSESFLAGNKGNPNFPTLPSKFAIPVRKHGQRKSLKLTDKTQEARRVLLSDINFTSMVPELSRSVDHLCQNGVRVVNASAINPVQSPYNPTATKYIRSPALLSSSSSYSSKFEFSVTNSNWNSFENSYLPDQGRSTQDLLVRRRQSWRPSLFSLDMYYANRTSSVPPSPTLRRHSAALSTFSPAGDSTQFTYPLPDKFNFKTASNVTLKNASSTSVDQKSKSKVQFRESLFSKNTGSRQSLPNMYVDTESGEESTESLIDESEEFVRKTIDTTLNRIDWPFIGYKYIGRTYSVPNLFLEFSPPFSARPFIAKSINDLKANYFAKVINKDGKVLGGRIQFVGNVPGKSEPYIGLMLPPNMGETDGTFQGVRFFSCEKNCGLFVPFRKVVMAWKV